MARFIRTSNTTFKMGNIKEVLKELNFEEKNIEKVCFEMVEAAAKKVYKKIIYKNTESNPILWKTSKMCKKIIL